MKHSISTKAVILSSKSFSEADKIIVAYTKNFGKLSFIAKGTKRPISRKRGYLEVFSYVNLYARKGKGIPLITEVEIIDSNSDIRLSLKKISVAYFIAEVISRTTREDEPNEEVFQILLNTLQELKEHEKLKKIRNLFSIRLMEIHGFIPENQRIFDPDLMLEGIIEKKLSSIRVGKKLLS